jgi:hypothetical protein
MFLERRMGNMTNLILFINAFLSYLLCFVFIIALVIIACVIGVKWRKSKDAKAALQSEETENAPTGNASA